MNFMLKLNWSVAKAMNHNLVSPFDGRRVQWGGASGVQREGGGAYQVVEENVDG